MTITIIPAAAGYYGLWYAPDSENGFGRAPIVGWRVTVEGDGHVPCTRPVVGGEFSDPVTAILCPDGTVNRLEGGHYWFTLEDWARRMGVRQ